MTDRINKFLPYMNSDEISDLVTYIDRDCEMLEIGGGNSTLFFSKIVKRLVTIEHNKEWSDKISNDMKSISKCDWSIHVVEPSFPQSHPFQPSEPGQFDMAGGSLSETVTEKLHESLLPLESVIT